MKQLKLLTASCIIFLLFTFGNCRKNNDEPQLPLETTTGAMTFGCKVNGKVFVPKDGNGHPGLYVQYVNLGNVPDGGWHLNMPAFDYKSNPNKGVSIETDSLLLAEGMSYEFKTTKGTANAFYLTNTTNGVDVYPKLDNESGSLFIKKHDLSQRILSGTFSFIGTNSSGAKVNVTEGRFDIRY
jgi:Family of unknown function (DUF6252)